MIDDDRSSRNLIEFYSFQRISEIRIKCNDGRLLSQLLDVIGYFLKYVVSDFDRLSVKPVPIPLMRSLSSRTASKTTGALASLWSMVSRKSVRDRPIGERLSDDSPSSRRGSNGFLSSSPSSPIPARAVPVILVKENGLSEEHEERPESISAMDENTVSVSSSINSSASNNFPSSTGASAEEDELLLSIFDQVEEKPISPGPCALTCHGVEPLIPLCSDLELHHKFASEELTSGRPLDVAISFCDFASSSNVDLSPGVLIIDATTW